ncbi:MAG TPA: LamG-like jellyroll fold domain-containing protein, partial [Cyclobacteriaceae bacterium]|nr:LamG-like jellyroll fold domain-containing protein [Cyclobacteriaceae bacterium]
SIGWLLYHAFLKTGNKKYLEGAEMSIEYLSGLTTNPSYELQLPYGTFVAAKMNAELGTQYDIEKMLNWSFNKGPLRNWGTIVGTWNGSDVSGLIGEANDAGNDYAFALNGFQQAAALVPLVKYDKRFARAIGKWTLNLANASRLYYSKYLPQADQDDYTWSSVNDPESVIAYEALKQSINGKNLYGTGDAKRGGWAQTNFGLYGSSSVGYLAALVETTDVDGILLLNLNKTDFFGKNVFPSYLVFNPYGATKQITLPLGIQSYDIYDAISESVIKTNATGNTLITIPSNEAMILTYLPQGSTPTVKNAKLYVNNDVVDYHVGYNFDGKLRIKSLSADTLVEFNQQVPVYATIENSTGAVTYNWYVNDELSSSSSAIDFNWTVPEEEGEYKILLEIINGTASAKDSLLLKVVTSIPTPPVIDGFTTNLTWYYSGTSATVACQAHDKKGRELTYNFTVDGGTLTDQQDSLIHWTVPQSEGFFKITCEVENEDNLKVSSTQSVLVKSMATGVTPPLAYYPLDGDVKDYSGNGYDATLSGAQLTTDEQSLANRAYSFSSGSDIIFVPNQSALNFQNQITLSFWVKVNTLAEESFIVSHGSWEERWKVSVTPDKKLRWTVKTFGGTLDLDSSQPIVLNNFYHVAVVYTGYSMELYVDGVLDTFVPNTGLMSTTSKDITFGRKDGTVQKYALKGTLDEVRLYDKALAPDEIATLKSLWNTVTGISPEATVSVYPNPSHGALIITGISKPVVHVEVIDVAGRKLNSTYSNSSSDKLLVEYESSPGLIIIKIETGTEVIYKKIMAF